MRYLALLAKHWAPGEAKTRLASEIGVERASLFQRLSLQATTARLAPYADQCWLYFSPAEREREMQELVGPAWVCQPQESGDLGERLAQIMAAVWPAGDSAVDHGGDRPGSATIGRQLVMVGADSPDLPVSFLVDAFDRLQTHDVVLGPAADGGYYLVGLSRPVPEIFTGIPWSTSEVCEQTRCRLRTVRAHWHELPLWYDVDHRADLARLRRELALRESASNSKEAVRDVDRSDAAWAERELWKFLQSLEAC